MDGPTKISGTTAAGGEASGALLEIEQLAVGAAAAPLFDGLSLSLRPGEVHAVVGANGSGKTTLLRAVLGEVEFRGRIRLRFRGGGRIGCVPQSLRFEPVLALTVGEFLALTRQRGAIALSINAATRRATAEALAAVDLEGFERRRVSELSGGELRRLLLAHALSPRPELLLLDEPTEGLDAASLPRLERALAQAAAGGSAILLVSHDLGLVRRLATQATWLDRTVRARGAAADVVAAFLRHELAAADAAP
jgi:zinc transport system ATP-binding protein